MKKDRADEILNKILEHLKQVNEKGRQILTAYEIANIGKSEVNLVIDLQKSKEK